MITKTLFKIGIAAALLTTLAVSLLGTQRVQALAVQARDSVVRLVDGQIDDQAALKMQLEELRATLPRELVHLRSELAAVQSELETIEREREVSRRIVELASNDRLDLEAQMAVALEAASPSYPSGTSTLGPVVQRLQERLAHAKSAELLYTGRIGEVEAQLDVLSRQRSYLVQLIEDREAEYASFLEQAAALENEVAVIARNEALLEWMQEREESIARHSRCEASDLAGLLKDLAEVREAQQAALGALAQAGRERSYERRARRELDSELAGLTPGRSTFSRVSEN